MGITYKKLTSHGSLSIPVAIRRELGMEPKDPVVLEIGEGNQIVVSAYRPRCIFCGSTDEVSVYRNKGVCPGCAEAVKHLMGGKNTG